MFSDTKPTIYQYECRAIPGMIMFCKCDTNRYFCGLDPCGCEDYSARPCPYGMDLQQDCGCRESLTSKR